MQQALKRAMDLLVALLALAVLSPLFLVIAILIRAGSPGPVFFRQPRLGQRGVTFLICKFRTMVNGCPDVRNADGSAYSGAGDSRVTPIGRWLRLSSIDELPQLWNVVTGEMSLVGPRPDQADQLCYYLPHDHQKLRVRPGLTGLAQISGRNRITWEERRRLDCDYVRRWSLRLDLDILMKTIPYVLLRRDIHEEALRVHRDSSAAQ